MRDIPMKRVRCMRWKRVFCATWDAMKKRPVRRQRHGGCRMHFRRGTKMGLAPKRIPTEKPMKISRRGLLGAGAALTGQALCGPWLRRALAEVAAPAPIRMTNGAGAAGLKFFLRNSAAGRKYQVETLPGGLGVIDFDGDGWPDLFCTNGASLPSLTKTGPEYWNRLYRNNHDGTFTDVTEKAGLQGQGYSMGVAVGDYNNDGHEDLFVVGVHANFLYRNNGDGTFTDVTRAAGVGGPGS